jgi:hypothetical protein
VSGTVQFLRQNGGRGLNPSDRCISITMKQLATIDTPSLRIRCDIALRFVLSHAPKDDAVYEAYVRSDADGGKANSSPRDPRVRQKVAPSTFEEGGHAAAVKGLNDALLRTATVPQPGSLVDHLPIADLVGIQKPAPKHPNKWRTKCQ